jgi:hypothetical protein
MGPGTIATIEALLVNIAMVPGALNLKQSVEGKLNV